MSELDRLEAAVGECREMIREAHAATKDLRAAVREAKKELHAWRRTRLPPISSSRCPASWRSWANGPARPLVSATQKVIAEFDRFGESLLGKETYWQTASGRRAVTRPDTDVVTLDVQPDEDKA